MPSDTDLILQGYCQGIFPMAENRHSEEFFWLSPPHRGILPLEKFHLSRSLAKKIRTGRFHPTIDKAFDQVITGCAARSETWISERLFKAYKNLNRKGFAHSIECWEKSELIGGVYGVAIGGSFFAESKFHYKRDASKMALYWLVHHLQSCGFVLLDVQFVTPHLEKLGAEKITNSEYKQRLHKALAVKASFSSDFQDF